MADRDCAICRGTGKYPASVDITGKLADCPDCTPEPTNLMRAALVAIQELHGRQLIHLPSWDPHGHPEYRESTQCKTCGSAENPCPSRRLADDALGGDNNG